MPTRTRQRPTRRRRTKYRNAAIPGSHNKPNASERRPLVVLPHLMFDFIDARAALDEASQEPSMPIQERERRSVRFFAVAGSLIDLHRRTADDPTFDDDLYAGVWTESQGHFKTLYKASG